MDNGPSQLPHSPTEELPWPQAPQLLPHPLGLASGCAQQEQLSPPQMHLLPAALCPCCQRLIYWPSFLLAGLAEHSRTGKCASHLGGFPSLSIVAPTQSALGNIAMAGEEEECEQVRAFGYFQCLFLKKLRRGLL